MNQEIKSYEYVRKFSYDIKNGYGAVESRICITYYDENGIPFTGLYRLAMYHPEKDEWQF
ncbi:MAG: hypothetical protein R3B55_02005 [Candidatus Paceibacterota bacterium]